MITALIGWALFGLIVGAIARLLIPGDQGLGLFATMLVGIAGSFVGGFLVYLIRGGDVLQSSSWIGSVIGSVILLIASSRLGNRRRIAG